MTMSCVAAASSMRFACSDAMCACSACTGVRPCRSQNSRRYSGTATASWPCEPSASRNASARVVLPVLSAPTMAMTKPRFMSGRRRGRDAPPFTPAGERHHDEDRVERDREPQPLVGEEPDADDVDHHPGGPALDVLAAEQPLPEHAGRGGEGVAPGHVGV